MREKGIQRGSVVLQPRSLALDAEAHVTGLILNPDSGHEPDKFRVGPVIENNKTRVDELTFTLPFDIMRMGVSPDVIILFKDRQITAGIQMISGREA